MATLRRLVAWLGGRRGVSLAVLTGWGALIVVGAGRSPDQSSWIGLPPLEWFVVAFVGLLGVLGIALVVATFVFRGDGESPPPPKKSWWPAIALLLLLVALSLRGPRDDEEEAVNDPTVVDDGGSVETGLRTNVLSGEELIALLLILVAAIGLLVWTRRRISSGPAASSGDEDSSLEAELTAAVGLAVDRLRLGNDPRSAVMIAYAGLEEALADLGLERQPNETPSEHLRRALAKVTIDSTPLLRLASLYEVARFSDHAITSGDQHDAADWLARAHRELRRRGATGSLAR